MNSGELHNRIRKPKERSTAMQKRLKSSMNKLSATVFANEGKVSRNIANTLMKLAVAHHTSLIHLNVRLQFTGHSMRVYLHSTGHQNEVIATEVISYLFTGRKTGISGQAKSIIFEEIRNYFMEHAKMKGIEPHNYTVIIHAHSDEPSIEAYHSTSFIGKIAPIDCLKNLRDQFC